MTPTGRDRRPVYVTFVFASIVINFSGLYLQWHVMKINRTFANIAEQSHRETERLAKEMARIKASTCASGSSAP